MLSDSPDIDVVALLGRLKGLRSEVAATRLGGVDALAPTWRPSAENLVRYLVLRHHDLRDLQRELSVLGLSSLGRSEADVAHTLTRVEAALAAIVDGAGDEFLACSRLPLDEHG